MPNKSRQARHEQASNTDGGQAEILNNGQILISALGEIRLPKPAAYETIYIFAILNI